MHGILFYYTDKKGKEIYFKEDPAGKEYTIKEAWALKLLNPEWTIRTDDWGYFYRAFTTKDVNPFWEDYDSLLQMTITIGVSGLLFFITGIINACKFCGGNFNAACRV